MFAGRAAALMLVHSIAESGEHLSMLFTPLERFRHAIKTSGAEHCKRKQAAETIGSARRLRKRSELFIIRICVAPSD